MLRARSSRGSAAAARPRASAPASSSRARLRRPLRAVASAPERGGSSIPNEAARGLVYRPRFADRKSSLVLHRSRLHASLPYRAATPATAAMATAEDIGAHVFDEGHWYHETLEEGLAISYRVRARAARSIVVTAAASERRTTDALSESSSPSIHPPPLAVAVLARFAPASTPPREPNLARRSSAPERSLALSLSRARPRRRRAARADASSLASSRRRQPPPLPSRRWTRSCTADRARSRPWRS